MSSSCLGCVLDKGCEGVSKFANDSRLGAAFDSLEGRGTSQRDFDK